jgi:hypothetical protein
MITVCCFSHYATAGAVTTKESVVQAFFSRDASFSSVKGERQGNNGKNKRLKLKSLQEMVLFDVVFPDSLQARSIASAILHIRSASPGKAPLARVTVSTLASPWQEGASSGFVQELGASCFVQARLGQKDWAYPGSSLMDVVMGRGNTRWKAADCTFPDAMGWQECAVDPDVVAANLHGMSYGFFLYDDVGTTWSIKDGKFEQQFLPNRFLYSRESRLSKPYLEIHPGVADAISPAPVESITVNIEKFPAGEALLSWKTPTDKGGGKTLGFLAKYQRDNGNWIDVPRYLIPLAALPEQLVFMHLRDLALQDGENIKIAVTAVDNAGNRSREFIQTLTVASAAGYKQIDPVDIVSFAPTVASLPAVSGIKVAVVDLLDKIDPVSGRMVPSRRSGYKRGNHLFSAEKKHIRLQSARNETVGFQVNLAGQVDDAVGIELTGLSPAKGKLFRAGYVLVDGGKTNKPFFLPDPLVESSGKFVLPSNAAPLDIAGQKNTSFFCELYVPHDMPAGDHAGQLLLKVGDKQLALSVSLKVWDFTLPDKLSFVPEMNAYSRVTPFKGYSYYRLAHEHRCCLNRLPYGWSGHPAFAPDWDETVFHWTAWDRAVGPLLDGSAFIDLPRKGEPVDVLYLPFNENWPVSLFDHYTPSYWADTAFDKDYRNGLQQAFSLFAAHCAEKGWNDTEFQFYLNNKLQYRTKNRKSSAPWRFDEPVDIKDFFALRWYGELFHEAVAPYEQQARFVYRADISYSQFGGTLLQDVTDIDYLGGNTLQKTRMKEEDRLHRSGEFAEYGHVNPISGDSIQPVLWCVSAWSRGAKGVLPWQTIGNSKSWKKANRQALFYPRQEGVAPSLRLKAFTVGQQLVEYLVLFSQVNDHPSWWIAGVLQKELPGLQGNVQKHSFNDAGYYAFAGIDPEKLWNIRMRLGRMISRKSPPYRRALLPKSSSLKESALQQHVDSMVIPSQNPPLSPEVDSFRP